MYFKISMRNDPQTGKIDGYYRLMDAGIVTEKNLRMVQDKGYDYQGYDYLCVTNV